MTQVVAVNFRDRFVITDDQRTLPITNFFDDDNEPTEEWRYAATFVAGSFEEWFAGRVCDWVPVAIN